MKRFLSVLISVSILLGCIPFFASAENDAYVGQDSLTLEQFAYQTEHLKQIGSDNMKLFNTGESENVIVESPDGTTEYVSREEARKYQTCRVIVKAKEAISDSNAIGMAGPYKDLYVFQYADEAAAQLACERFAGRPDVIYAEPSRMSAVSGMEYTDINTWGYEVVNFPVISEFVSSKYGSNVDDIVIAVIDSGIDYNHPLFKNRIADNGYDFVNNDDDPTDDHMHGTAVSGVIASSTPEYVKILPIKSGNADGGLEDLDIYLGIQYAIQQDADIINMSYGAPGKSETEEEAIKEANAAGILMAASYGNYSTDTSEFYPASFSEVIGVSSINNYETLSGFSNYGDNVDVAAPGEQIYTAYPTDMGDNSGYQMQSGTSFSCPYVAAALAMIKASNPEYTENQIKKLLYSNAIDYGEPGWDKYFGYGMISFNEYSETGYEASIDKIHYLTLSDAISAASDGDNIILISDVSLSETLSIDKDITISAKEQTISRADGFKGNMINVKSGKTLTLGNDDDPNTFKLTIDGGLEDQKTESCIYISDGANVIVKNNTRIINNNSSGSGGAFYNDGKLQLYDAEIDGNTAVEKGNGIYNSVGSELVISAQTQISKEDIIYISDGVEIYVDYNLRPDECVAVLDIENYSNEKIIANYAEGCTPTAKQFKLTDMNYRTANRSNKLILKSQPAYEARIGENMYTSIADAFSAAQQGDRIVLLKDVSLNSAIEITKELTLSAEDECWLTRDASLTDDIITVKNGGKLILDSENKDVRNLCIGGDDIAVNAGAVKVMNGGEAELKNVYITEHHGTEDGNSALTVENGGTAIIDGATITNNKSETSGGGIYNAGTLTINSGTIAGNESYMYAGGIANKGDFKLNGGNVLNNTTLYMGGGVANWEDFEMNGGAISNNSCTYNSMSSYQDYGTGGGVWNSGNMIINNGEISANLSHVYGGGIFNSAISSNADPDPIQNTITHEQGVVSIHGGVITDNESKQENESGFSIIESGIGGGMANFGAIYMDDGIISNNYASNYGGGLYNHKYFQMTGGEFAYNRIYEGKEATMMANTCSGSEISAGYIDHNDQVLTTTSLLGGKICSGDLSNSDESLFSYGDASRLLIGGDIEFNKDITIGLRYSKIEVTSIIKNNDFPIGVILKDRYPRDGKVLVTYTDGLTPDMGRFYDLNSYALKQEGQNIVLTNDSVDVDVEGYFDGMHENGMQFMSYNWEIKNHVLRTHGGDITFCRRNSYIDVPWARYKAAVERIEIADGAGGIDVFGFADMYNLKSVSLPITLCAIDNYAFLDCVSLETVRFTGSKLDNYFSTEAFSGCGNITVEYPEGDDTWLPCIGNNYGAESVNWVAFTPEPSEEPTPTPTAEPTVEPTLAPSPTPTVEPTIEPTIEPTPIPTVEPTVEPTIEPTPTPTVEPTVEPTEEPTSTPTAEPTATPMPEPVDSDFAQILEPVMINNEQYIHYGIQNNTGQIMSAVYVVAVYNKDGTLNRLHGLIDGIIREDGLDNITPIDDNVGAVKSFIWKDFDSLQPYPDTETLYWSNETQ